MSKAKDIAEAAMAYEAGRVVAADIAAAVADRLLDNAVAKLDGLFGEGYARANPALVAAYLAAGAEIFQTDITNVSDFDDELDLPFPDLDRRR